MESFGTAERKNSHVRIIWATNSERCSFVCSVAKETTGVTRLRSYKIDDERNVEATIADAALATSAATGFFEPVSIGARHFVDGGLGANNPVDEIEGEAAVGSLRSSYSSQPVSGIGKADSKPVEHLVLWNWRSQAPREMLRVNRNRKTQQESHR